MKMKLIYILIIIFFLSFNLNNALKKKAFLTQSTEELKTPDQTGKKTAEAQSTQEINKNENLKVRVDEAKLTEATDKKNNIISDQKEYDVKKKENADTKPISKIIDISTSSTESASKIEPSGMKDSKTIEKTSTTDDLVADKVKSNEKQESSVTKINQEASLKYRVSAETEVEYYKGFNNKVNLENNQPNKVEAEIKPEVNEKVNTANLAQQPEHTEKVQAPLENSKTIYPVSYHRQDPVVMNVTPMVSPMARIAATYVPTPYATPVQTFSTPLMTQSLLPPQPMIRDTTTFNQQVGPMGPIQMMQRNLRAMELAPPVQAIQQVAHPFAAQGQITTSQSVPANTVTRVTTTTVSQPSTIQRIVTQNTINGIPHGPPSVNTIVTPSSSQVVNRVVSQVNVVNGGVMPYPNQISRVVSNPMMNGMVSNQMMNGMVSNQMVNGMVTSTPVVNGFTSNYPTLVNRMATTPNMSVISSPPSMMNGMIASNPLVGGYPSNYPTVVNRMAPYPNANVISSPPSMMNRYYANTPGVNNFLNQPVGNNLYVVG